MQYITLQSLSAKITRRLIYRIAAIAAFASCFVVFGQQTTSAPQTVSDMTAYRFVLLSISLPQNPTATDTIKRDLRFMRIGLNASDEAALQALLVNFSRDYAAWRSGIASVPSSVSLSQRDNLVQQYCALINQTLSSTGQSALTQYVVGEKQKMHP